MAEVCLCLLGGIILIMLAVYQTQITVKLINIVLRDYIRSFSLFSEGIHRSVVTQHSKKIFHVLVEWPACPMHHKRYADGSPATMEAKTQYSLYMYKMLMLYLAALENLSCKTQPGCLRKL